MECICWSSDNLEKMSPYYIICCSPSTRFVNNRVDHCGRYDFRLKWERSVRGHKFYRQRYWKGKWRH